MGSGTREYSVFYEPKLGVAYAYHFPTGGIFELTEDEYRRLPSEDLLEEMRAYDGPRYSFSDFISHLGGVGAEVDGLNTPAYVEIEVTQRCNLKCVHCYVRSSPTAPEGLPAEEWVKIVKGLDRTVLLGVTGGEPLVKRGIMGILATAKERGLVVKLLTNGVLLPKRFDELKKVLEPGVDIIQISLDGGKEAHEAIRGAGTFEPTLEAIRMASRYYRVEVSFTLLPMNISAAKEAYVEAARAGASVFRVGNLMPIGRGSSFSTNYSTHLKVSRELKELEKVYGLPVSASLTETVNEEGPDITSFYPCPAGISFAFISHDGTVYPCQAFRPAMKMGNAAKEPLYKIWERFNRRIFKRNLRGTKCERCPLFPACKGGCPAIAYLLKGTINEPTPLCDLK